MNDPEKKAILQLRNIAGWWAGDPNAEAVLAEYRASVMSPIAAALSFDPAVDRDLETCARRLYHENVDLKFAARGLAAKVRADQRPNEL